MLKKSLVVALCSVVALGAFAAAAFAVVVAHNGFLPNPNGFSIGNFGGGYATSVEMRKLFGSAVCANYTTEEEHVAPPSPVGPPVRPPSPTVTGAPDQPSGAAAPFAFAAASEPSPCTLTSDAQTWLNEVNESAAGGNCQGFSVLALRLWKGQWEWPPFGPGTTFSLSRTPPLERALTMNFATQYLASVRAARRIYTPNSMVNYLVQHLTPGNEETYTMGVYGQLGGHALTPYGVDNVGGGYVDVYVYDSNYPGASNRAIRFHTPSNTWAYQLQPGVIFRGSATSPNMDIEPTSPGIGVQPWPQPATEGSAAFVDMVGLAGSLQDHSHLVITTGPHGPVAASPVARCERPGESVEPNYLFPSSNHTITVDGSHLRHTDTETVNDVGAGQSLALQNVKVGPGQRDVVRLRSGVSNVAFTAARGAGSGSPVLRLGAHSAKADYAVELKLVDFHPGATLHVKLNVAKELITFFSTGNSGSATYVLRVVKHTKHATMVTAPATAHLRGTESAKYSYAH